LKIRHPRLSIGLSVFIGEQYLTGDFDSLLQEDYEPEMLHQQQLMSAPDTN
jgi:hypothetical protein